jgi:zinc protease
VTAQDVTRVVKTYFRPDNLSIGILEPSDKTVALSDKTLASLFRIPSSEKSEPSDGDSGNAKAARRVILPSGMRLIIKENHALPEVSMTGVFLGGTRLETPKEWGVSNFVAQMLTRGTSKRTMVEIATMVASRGAKLSGFSGRNSIGVSAKFLSRDLNTGLALVADVIQNSNFPPDELAKVKADILAGIKAKKDRPMSLLFDLFYKTLYPHYPYGHPASGTRETISNMDREDLINWYRRIAFPANFVLSVVGDVDSDQLIPYVEQRFKSFPARTGRIADISPEPPLKEILRAHLKRPGAQTHLIWGYLGADLKSKANAPMALVKTVLSGQSGRLFYQLRDKQSLAYAITAFRRPGLETGAFGVYLACDPTKLDEAEKGIENQLGSLRKNGITEKELNDAKAYLLGNMAIDYQTNGSQAMQMALDELYGLGYNDRQRYMDKIKSVTLNDIQAAVRKIILPEKHIIVTVGP